MDTVACKQVKETVFMLMSEQRLKGKIFVAGGIVPWILSGNDSNRKHNDIDIVVAIQDMGLLREYLHSRGYYQRNMDSRCLGCNPHQLEYGLEAFIHHIPVNFAPFESKGNHVVQKNFMLERYAGYDALVDARMRNLSIDDYVTTCIIDPVGTIGMYTLEVVKAAKENSNRDKDIHDIREIDRIGIDIARYQRVKPSIQSMKIEYTEAKEP